LIKILTVCAGFELDFQLYLGRIEERRRERLSCYELKRAESGKEHVKPQAKDREEVHTLIREVRNMVVERERARDTVGLI
jgi:hypothetical protein